MSSQHDLRCRSRLLRFWCFLFATNLIASPGFAQQGVEKVTFYGYEDCIRLSNENIEVVLCPAAGGRVLKYALKGENILYLPTGDEGWTWDGKSNRGRLNAGRFDIGPEQVVPKRPLLWQGRWQAEIIGPRSARLISPVDPGPGVRLIRTFELDEQSSKLSCKQTIESHSDTPVEYCHWSRTFANGHGICIIPLSKPLRFSEGYVRYDPPGKMLNMKPTDRNIRREGDFLIITDRPEYPKLGFDSYAGWLAYHSKQDLLFVKKFPTYPERAYNEVAGLTVSVWYPDNDMVELEPIGPKERLENRGDQATFEETWFLLEHKCPAEDEVDAQAIAKLVQKL